MSTLTPSFALLQREVLRFVRQRSRVTGALAQPLVFWVLLGGGLNASFQPAGAPAETSYVQYFFPGTIVMVLLFTAIFSTISTVDDRREGFLQGVLVAPIARWEIVLGQCLGGTLLAVVQATLCLAIAPWLGIPLTPWGVAGAVGVMTAVALALTSLGLVIAWRMDSTQGFHAIMNLLLLPMWLLSGALFPATGAPAPLAWIMTVNPLTYGLAALRSFLYLGAPEQAGQLPPLGMSLGITFAFAVSMFAAATWTAQRRAL